MTDFERLEERCNFAEAKCAQLQDQLDETQDDLSEALLKLERISNVLAPDEYDVW